MAFDYNCFVTKEFQVKMRILEPHLATRDARRGLLRRATPYWLPLRRGLALGYRCGLTEGTWLVKVCEPGLRKQARLGLADDLAEADGGRVLSFETARATALAWAPKSGVKTAQFRQVLSNPTTVGEVVLSYLTYLEKEKLSTAWKKSWAMANHYILHHPIAKIRVRNLKYSDIDGWRNEIAERIPMSRSRKPREEVRLPLDESAETLERKRARQCTANRVLALLKAALNRAKATGTADRDPFWTLTDGAAWRQVRLYAGVYRSRKRFLSIQEQRDLVAACPDGLRQLVQGALATGARFGELATMRVREVYLVSATITLDTSKTKVTRRIPILPESMEFFRRLVQGKSPEAFLFLRSDGKAWKTNQYVRPLQIAVSKAGIDPVCFHELRHTYASTMVMAGVTAAALARAMGHKTEKMVLETYGHLKPSWATQEVLDKAPKLGIFKSRRGKRRASEKS